MGKICLRWVVDVGRANEVCAIVGSPRNLRNYVGIPNLLRANSPRINSLQLIKDAPHQQIRGDS